MSAHMAWVGRCIVLLGIACSALPARGEEKLPVRTKSAEVNEKHRTVDLFAGMEKGDLEVRYIPRDEKEGRVYITNRSGEPLNVQLPPTVAAVPVLAQFGFPTNNNRGNQNQAPQPVGGPFSFQNGANRNGGSNNNTFFNSNNAGPIFNIPADQVGEIRISTVCLEHGKPNPKPLIPYKLVALESVCNDATLSAMLTKLGEGKCSQREAQAAAWHLANEMSWEDLAKEKGEMIAIGENRPYFSKKELKRAEELVKESTSTKKPASKK